MFKAHLCHAVWLYLCSLFNSPSLLTGAIDTLVVGGKFKHSWSEPHPILQVSGDPAISLKHWSENNRKLIIMTPISNKVKILNTDRGEFCVYRVWTNVPLNWADLNLGKLDDSELPQRNCWLNTDVRTYRVGCLMDFCNKMWIHPGRKHPVFLKIFRSL